MAVLRNFRPLTNSSARIDPKDVLSFFYVFLQLWNLILVELFAYTKNTWKQYQYRKEAKSSSTIKVFGKVVTLDINPKECPRDADIVAAEANMPKCCQHGWFSSVTGQQLHYRYFLPADRERPKAIIIWMHGLQGSSGEAHTLQDRKTNMALQAETYLKERYALYAMDMLGHGYSEGSRWYMPNGDIMLSDYIQFVQRVASYHDPDTPLFLSGYSYGGCLTLRAAKYFQDHFSGTPKGISVAGILLQAPAIYDLECFFLFPLALWVARTLVNPVVGSNFRPPTWVPNRVHPRRFWRDPERYRVGMDTSNGLNAAGRHIPMQTCLTLVKDMITLRSKTIPNLTVPFGVVHGGQDKVVPLSGTNYLQRASLTAKEDQAAQLFPESYHDMLAEPEADDVMRFQVNWIKSRIERMIQCNAINQSPWNTCE